MEVMFQFCGLLMKEAHFGFRHLLSVYKRLKTTLNPYQKTVAGKKLLHIKALEVLKAGAVDNPPGNVEPGLNMEILNLTRDNLQFLRDQLTTKDDQIKALLEELTAKNNQLSDLNDKLNQALINASQANFITATNQKALEVKPIEAPIKKSLWDRIRGR